MNLYVKQYSCLGLLALATLLFSQSLFSQGQVSGSLRDASGQPVAFANVLVLVAADSTLLRGSLTDEDGNFQFDNIGAGTYLVQFSMLGFEELTSESLVFSESTPPLRLGEIVLRENSELLDEVLVSAKRPFLEQKIDRTVVNVSNSITNAGGTALQVLQRSPGVQVNALTKSISLAGKQGVVVMINDKITRLSADAVVDMLAGMNADNIDRIELIHTPPANFEAQGNAGIINIILKSSTDEGLNGGYSAKGGYGRGEKYGLGGYANYRSKGVNLFGNFDLDHNLNPQTFTNYRRVNIGADLLETSSDSDRPHTPTTTQNGRIGADFQVSKRTVVGVLGTYFDRNWYMEAVNEVKYQRNGATDSLLRMPNTETNHTRSLAGNLNISHQLSENQSLNLDADFINYDIQNPSDYELQNLDANGLPISSNALRINKATPIRIGVAKADYALTLGEKSRIETGVKFTSMRFENDVQVDERMGQQPWRPVSLYTSVSNLNEWVAGAYAGFSTKLGPSTDLKAGLRYEHTDTRLDSAASVPIVDRNYGSWFPSLFITQKMNEHQSFNFSYARRITRPSIRRLAPWLIFSDPTTLEGGNPALQPSFTDAFNLSYVFKAYQLSLSYSIEDSPMRFVPNVDIATNRQFNFHQNMDVEKTWAANLYIPLHPTGWWDVSANVYLNASQLDFELEGKTLQIDNVAYGLNISNTFRLPRAFTVELTGNYDSPSYWGIAYWRATGSLNVGIEKNLGPKWGKIRLNINDILLSTNWFGTTSQPEVGLYVKSSYQIAERVFMLSWTNTFGNRALKSARERQSGAAEELRRI